jgi:putative flippase GtrA
VTGTDRNIRGEFVRFALVGAIGFVVDSGVLYAGLAVGFGLYFGRLVSYLAAATTTWFLNRHLTFSSSGGAWWREWLRFLAANAVGGLANLAVYTVLVTAIASVAAHPLIAVAAGSLTGLASNFHLSRRLVFRTGKP